MTSRAYPPPETTRSKGPILLLVAVLAALALLLPLTMWLDSGLDEDRKMYLDRQDMAWFQHLNASAGIAPVAAKLAPGEEFTLAAGTFSSRPGVSVEVTTEADPELDEEGNPIYSYCVRASNDQGEQTSWLCHSTLSPPAAPTGDPLADL